MRCKNCGKEIRLWMKGGTLLVDEHNKSECPEFTGEKPDKFKDFDYPHLPETEVDIAKRIIQSYE